MAPEPGLGRIWLPGGGSDRVGRSPGRPMAINGRRYAEMMSEGFVCRVDRLRDHLGIVAQVGLAEGLAQTADWYRRERWF